MPQTEEIRVIKERLVEVLHHIRCSDNCPMAADICDTFDGIADECEDRLIAYLTGRENRVGDDNEMRRE